LRASEPSMTKRKRRKIAKAGPRYPTSNHRLYNEHGGALWRRIVDEGVRFGHLNPQLGSEVGRLCFNDAITSIEAAAASRVAEIYGRYERTQGMRRSAASPTYMNVNPPDRPNGRPNLKAVN
jgi:hypothetical protein